MDWMNILWIVLILVISAIPLNIAVKLLGGRSSLLKAMLVNFLVGIINGFIQARMKILAGVVSFVLLLLIYKFMFRIGWIRAVLVWLLRFIIIAIVVIALFLLFGIALFF